MNNNTIIDFIWCSLMIGDTQFLDNPKLWNAICQGADQTGPMSVSVVLICKDIKDAKNYNIEHSECNIILCDSAEMAKLIVKIYDNITGYIYTEKGAQLKDFKNIKTIINEKAI